MLGVIGEYLWRNFMNQKEPMFIIDETVGFKTEIPNKK
jgi:hypothetical protein